MTGKERRSAQRRVARELKAGRSPLGGEYKEIVRKAISRGQLFKSLDSAIDYAKSINIPSFIVAYGYPNDPSKYKVNHRWLSLGGMTDPNFHEWSRKGYEQRQAELFGNVTSYRVMAMVGKPA